MSYRVSLNGHLYSAKKKIVHDKALAGRKLFHEIIDIEHDAGFCGWSIRTVTHAGGRCNNKMGNTLPENLAHPVLIYATGRLVEAMGLH